MSSRETGKIIKREALSDSGCGLMYNYEACFDKPNRKRRFIFSSKKLIKIGKKVALRDMDGNKLGATSERFALSVGPESREVIFFRGGKRKVYFREERHLSDVLSK